MRKIAVALLALSWAGVAGAQLPTQRLEPGVGIASRGGGASILYGETTGYFRAGDMTPTMERQRMRQVVALRDEMAQRSAGNGGELNAADRDYFARKARRIAGLRR